MSEETGVHVHAAHEHAVEHEAEHGDGLAQKVALLTAILATIGALFSYQASSTQTEATLLKNSSIAKQTQAADQWAYFQAQSTKAYIAETAAAQASDPAVKARFAADAARHNAEKTVIQKDAQKLEAQAKAFDDESEQLMRPHHRLARGMTLLQIAVALASITVLTRKKWLFVAALLAAVGGVGVALLG